MKKVFDNVGDYLNWLGWEVDDEDSKKLLEFVGDNDVKIEFDEDVEDMDYLYMCDKIYVLEFNWRNSLIIYEKLE